MKLIETSLPGAFLVEPDFFGDERGFFAQCFVGKVFDDAGLESAFVQMNLSQSKACHTLRGLHYQLEPSAQTKLLLVRVGRLYDVILDLRQSSPTFGHSVCFELSAADGRLLYVPRGCAHGFMTLEENTELIYLVSQPYDPSRERGIRWDDPRFAIEWPATPTVISQRDREHPDFDETYHLG